MANEDIILKVCASKEPGYAKKLAGAIAWRLRDGGFCHLRSVKEVATNSAIKAIAICNKKVAAADVLLGMNLTFSRLEGTTAIEMLVEEVSGEMPPESVEYRVSGRDGGEALNAKLADAIAVASLDGKKVSLKCIGSAAVYRAIISSILAKGTIFTNGMSAIVVPSWESMPGENDKQISLINIDFWAKQL